MFIFSVFFVFIKWASFLNLTPVDLLASAWQQSHLPTYFLYSGGSQNTAHSMKQIGNLTNWTNLTLLNRDILLVNLAKIY